MRWLESWDEIGQRFAAARADAGWTQAQVAERAELERTALAKIERGQRQVSALELSKLATALGRPMGWFLRESAPAVVSRRSELLESAETKPLDDVIETVARDVELLQELELLRGPVPPEPLPVPRSSEEAEAAARLLRMRLDLGDGPLDDLLAIAEGLALYVFVLELEPRDVDGAYVALDKGGVALVNGRHPSGRRRFTLVHELGHHVFADAFATDWHLDEAGGQAEKLINSFSAFFLLPRAGASHRWQELNGPGDPRSAALRIAVEYRLSWSALCAHLRNCGLIDEATRIELIGRLPHRAEWLELGREPVQDVIPPALPPGYVRAVRSGFRRRRLGASRAVELLHGTAAVDDLPEPAPIRTDALFDEVGPPL
jgi:transcriptional regulator with XRE-family HTH domain